MCFKVKKKTGKFWLPLPQTASCEENYEGLIYVTGTYAVKRRLRPQSLFSSSQAMCSQTSLSLIEIKQLWNNESPFQGYNSG